MRIISIGSSPLMIHGILSGFRQLGYDTGHFPHRSWYKLNPDKGAEYLKNDLEDTKPDHLIFGGYAPKYFKIIPELCQKQGIGFIYWAIEDPPGFNNSLFLARKADLVFTTAVECISQYTEQGINAHLLPFACNPSYHKTGISNPDYALDLALVASYYTWETRKKGYNIILDAARESGTSFKVWGAGWQREKARERLVDPSLYQGYFPNGQLPDLCASTKIILGIQCDDSSLTQTSMRPYEVLGCQGFHLTQWTKATVNIFTEGKHLVTARSKEEAREKIRYYLNHPAIRKTIAKQGQKFVYKYHTYKQRVQDIIIPLIERG